MVIEKIDEFDLVDDLTDSKIKKNKVNFKSN